MCYIARKKITMFPSVKVCLKPACSVTRNSWNREISDNTTGNMSLVVRKPVFGVSDQVPHKPGCTATQDG